MAIEWNDDERDVSYVLRRDQVPESYKIKPITKIMKELYDEQNAKLFCNSPEYKYAYEFDGFEDDYYCSTINRVSPLSSSCSISKDGDDDDTTSISSTSEELEMPNNVEDNDIIDNMIYKKFCYC